MKYLLAMIIIAFLVYSPNAASAKEVTIWSKGSTVVTITICKDEETILKIVKADTISEEEVLARMYALTSLKYCINLPMPLPFYVKALLVEYKDFRQIDSVVLSIAKINEPDKHIGFVLAAGKYQEDKGI